MHNAEIIADLKYAKKPIIIAGAGIVGEQIFQLLTELEIDVTCFCDNSVKVARSDFLGKQVIHTPSLKEHFSDAVIIISAAAIKDAVDLLQEQGFTHWYAGGMLLKDYDVSQAEAEVSIDYTKFAVENCILCHDGYMTPDRLFMRSIDLIITEKCSLKCRDCSNLMQYYPNPQNCDTEALLKVVDRYFQIVDEVMDFRIIGGETFMNKEWPIIAERLINEPKAKRVILYTNGTILPRLETIELLQHEKMLIIATDYGLELSRKLDLLKEFMLSNHIAHHILEIDEWLDCSSIFRHNRSVEDNTEIFKMCCAKNMATLSDGKLFRCPYSANAERLAAIEDPVGDYVDLMTPDFQPEQAGQMKAKVMEFLLSKDFLNSCDYCSGRPLSGNEVKPAVQIKNPLEYVSFAQSSMEG